LHIIQLQLSNQSELKCVALFTGKNYKTNGAPMAPNAVDTNALARTLPQACCDKICIARMQQAPMNNSGDPHSGRLSTLAAPFASCESFEGKRAYVPDASYKERLLL
jgi:hypothetical protein